MAYDLKHTGEAIDAAIYAVERGSVVTDNTVSSIAPGEAKPASADAIAKELQKKVDKVEGKGLSTNDYSDEEKEQVERVRTGSVVIENTLSEFDETSNKPVNSKGIAEAIEAAVYPISDNIGQIGLHETYRSGNLLCILEYTPYRPILNDTTIKVTPSDASTIKGVSITVKRDGNVKYIPFSKANDFYYFQALAGDEIVNLYVNNGGEEGEVVKVLYATDLIRWMAIGDSLTSAYTLGGDKDNYVSLVAKRLGIVAINKGAGGTGYWKTKNINTAFFQRIPTYTEEADVITIFGSFNDLATEDGVSGASVIGEISDTTTDTICGCINATLDAIEEYYPNAIVGIITPTPWSNSHASINPESYVTKLKEIAEYRSIPCLDLFHSSNLRPWEESFREMYYINKEDGTHPNTLGHKRISGMITNFIQSIMF